jgi:hypothetical protein
MAYYSVEKDRHGRPMLVTVGRTSVTPEESALVIPDLRVAGSASQQKYDLVGVIWVGRTAYSGYEWLAESSFKWYGSPPASINVGNRVEDMYGVSWAGDLYLHRDSAAVYWDFSCDNEVQGDVYRSDMTPNEGVGWSFRETRGCAAVLYEHIDRGRGGAWIRESSWKGRKSNVAMRYVHTWGSSDVSYSLSFANASISYSPSSSTTWSVAPYTSFTH